MEGKKHRRKIQDDTRTHKMKIKNLNKPRWDVISKEKRGNVREVEDWRTAEQ